MALLWLSPLRIHTFCIVHKGLVPSPCDFRSESPRKLVQRKIVNYYILMLLSTFGLTGLSTDLKVVAKTKGDS